MSQTSNDLFTFSKCIIRPLTPSKSNFLCKKLKNVQAPVEKIIKGEEMISFNSVKFLDVTVDRNLTYQVGTQIILRKMAVGKKAMHTICSICGEQTRFPLHKSIIFNHLQYLFLLLTGITSNLVDTLGQDINWALKTFF